MNEAEINAISPGPYEWAIIPAGPNQMETIKKLVDLGSGDCHMIWLPKHPLSVIGQDPEKPDRAVILCMVGNGENSKNNVRALCCLLNQREIIKADKPKLPMPTTPDCVAWAEYALGLEHALGLAMPIPERLMKLDITKHLDRDTEPKP